MALDGPVFKRWTHGDDEYLRSNWGRVGISEIAAVLRRTEGSVKQRAYKVMGTTLDRDPKPGRIKGRRIGLDGKRQQGWSKDS